MSWLGRLLFLWQLKATSKNSWDSNILIELFPSERKSVHFNSNLFQLFVACRGQSRKPIGREAPKPTIMGFDKYCSSFGPSADGGRLQGNRCISENGGHNMLF